MASTHGEGIDNRTPEQRRRLLRLAIAACMLAARGAQAQQGDGKLEEIVVTATKRSENLQAVPIAITALTGKMLSQLNVTTFDDYLRYVPNIAAAGKGPGMNEVYMRGLSTTQGGQQGGAGIGSFPNVAIYLDDQSVQLPSRNLDIYAADLERIEVLEGPQGTLYGAGAQAGAIRYITNKPKLDLYEVNASVGHDITEHGDPSNRVEAVINLPLIPDKLAVRVLVYDDKRGGYIHNIPGNFERSNSDLGVAYYFSDVPDIRDISEPLDNAALVDDSYNPSEYRGTRVSALYQINDDWNLLVQGSHQDLEADGVSWYQPELGDLNVQQYNKSRGRDEFNNAAWTVNGRLDALKIVYTGGYLVHESDQVTDYTNYARGFFAAYYQCNGAGRFYYQTGTGPDRCYSPSSVWHDDLRNTHQSHELRVSTPDDARWRAIGGLFWEDFKIEDSINFQYAQEAAGFAPYGPLPGTTAYDPDVRDSGVAFFNDITRGYKQKAAFGELAYDILPETLTLTLGTRFYDMETYEKGSNNSAYGCRNLDPTSGCSGSSSLDIVTFADGSKGPLQKTFSGHRDKINLKWDVAEGKMLYATYSEGFRPGGFNRGQGVINSYSPLFGVFTVPVSFDTDDLLNYEIGWKTTWLEQTLQLNGAIYEEKWESVQLAIFDPSLYGNQVFSTNGPDYRVRGLETEVVWRATEQLTVNSSFAWNDSEQTNDPQLIGNDGVAVSLFPTAGRGSPLAQSPKFQGNIRARYDFVVSGFDAHWQIGAQHVTHSYASVVTVGSPLPYNQRQEGYTTYDATAGIEKGAWALEFYGQNLSDKRAELYVNPFDFVLAVTTNRPRTFGMKLSYQFSKEP